MLLLSIKLRTLRAFLWTTQILKTKVISFRLLGTFSQTDLVPQKKKKINEIPMIRTTGEIQFEQT